MNGADKVNRRLTKSLKSRTRRHPFQLAGDWLETVKVLYTTGKAFQELAAPGDDGGN